MFSYAHSGTQVPSLLWLRGYRPKNGLGSNIDQAAQNKVEDNILKRQAQGNFTLPLSIQNFFKEPITMNFSILFDQGI